MVQRKALRLLPHKLGNHTYDVAADLTQQKMYEVRPCLRLSDLDSSHLLSKIQSEMLFISTVLDIYQVYQNI